MNPHGVVARPAYVDTIDTIELARWNHGVQRAMDAYTLHLELLERAEQSGCGTIAGWRMHQEATEPPCEDCRVARADYDHRRYLLRKGRRR